MLTIVKRNDTHDAIEYQLENEDGTSVDLTGASVSFVMGKKNKLITNAPASITSAINGIVQYQLTETDTLISGTFLGEFIVTFADGTKKTYPSNGYITVNIEQNLDTNLSNVVLDMIAEKQGEFTAKLNSILQQAGNVNMSYMDEYNWTSNEGQVTYTFPITSTYTSNVKWFEVFAGNVPVDNSLVNRTTENSFTLNVDPTRISAGITVSARWVQPISPIGPSIYKEIPQQPTPPADAQEGDLWFDTSDNVYQGTIFDDLTAQLEEITKEVYVENFKIQIPEIDDTERIKRARDSMGTSKNKLIFDSKLYTFSSDITFPDGVSLEGTGVTKIDGFGTQIKRTNNTAKIVFQGTSILSANPAPFRWISIKGIRFHGNAPSDTSIVQDDLMQMFACGVVYMQDVEFYSTRGRQLLLHEVMDSRFNNCVFEWGGLDDGTRAAIELKSGSGYEYTNQIHFVGCRFEHYRSKAIETTGTNTNEIFFTDVKMESLQSRTAHLYLNNANMIHFSGLQITSKGSRDSLWTTATSYSSGAKCVANGKTYQATTSGTSGATKPSHTSGTVSDGGVSWSYVETLPLIPCVIYASSCSGIFGSVFFEHLRTVGDDAAPIDNFIDIINSKNVELFTYVYQNGNNISNDSIVRVSTDSLWTSINVRGQIKDDNGTKKICNNPNEIRKLRDISTNIEFFRHLAVTQPDGNLDWKPVFDYMETQVLTPKVPYGTYNIYSRLTNRRIEGVGNQRSIINQKTLSEPVIETNGRVNFSNFKIQHDSVPSALSIPDGVGILITDMPDGSVVKELEIANVTSGICLTGTGHVYSSSFRDIRITGFNHSAVYIGGDGHTGSVWQNIYAVNWLDYDAGTKRTSTYGFYFTNTNEGIYQQLNLEHGKYGKGIVITGGNARIDSVHFEGYVANTDYGALFNVDGTNTKVIVSNVELVYSTFDSVNMSNYAFLALGNNAKFKIVLFDENNNTVVGTPTLRKFYGNGTIGSGAYIEAELFHMANNLFNATNYFPNTPTNPYVRKFNQEFQVFTPVASSTVSNQAIFIDSADNKLKFKDSTGTVNLLY